MTSGLVIFCAHGAMKLNPEITLIIGTVLAKPNQEKQMFHSSDIVEYFACLAFAIRNIGFSRSLKLRTIKDIISLWKPDVYTKCTDFQLLPLSTQWTAVPVGFTLGLAVVMCSTVKSTSSGEILTMSITERLFWQQHEHVHLKQPHCYTWCKRILFFFHAHLC